MRAALVLDSSVAIAWLMKDEIDPTADAAMDELIIAAAKVPANWPLEVANALLMAERRGRVTQLEGDEYSRLLRTLPIEVDMVCAEGLSAAILVLAREQALTTYDAAYLELALRVQLPLATVDVALAGALRRLGGTCYGD